MPDQPDRNWKLRLRYGKWKTPFTHFTTISDGIVEDLAHGFACRSGPAIMGMKLWAETQTEAIEMTRAIGRKIGFRVTGRIQLYTTEPDEPPREQPYAYGVNFHAYEES